MSKWIIEESEFTDTHENALLNLELVAKIELKDYSSIGSFGIAFYSSSLEILNQEIFNDKAKASLRYEELKKLLLSN